MAKYAKLVKGLKIIFNDTYLWQLIQHKTKAGYVIYGVFSFCTYIFVYVESKADNCALLFFADKVHIFCYDCV
jgi:hypothetical protein